MAHLVLVLLLALPMRSSTQVHCPMKDLKCLNQSSAESLLLSCRKHFTFEKMGTWLRTNKTSMDDCKHSFWCWATNWRYIVTWILFQMSTLHCHLLSNCSVFRCAYILWRAGSNMFLQLLVNAVKFMLVKENDLCRLFPLRTMMSRTDSSMMTKPFCIWP